jgi:hypothetical protein
MGQTERRLRLWITPSLRAAAGRRWGTPRTSNGTNTISFGCCEREVVGLQRGSVVSLRYFFFGLALLLVEDFGLAAGLVFLPDRHPHVLHILAPLQKGNQLSMMTPQHRTLVP